MNSNDISNFVDSIKAWETRLSSYINENPNQISEAEKKNLFITSSVARYSLAYWSNAFENGSGWLDIAVSDSDDSEHEQTSSLFGWLGDLVDWVADNWVGCVSVAASDIAGGLWGGPLGAITGSASTTLFWTFYPGYGWK